MKTKLLLFALLLISSAGYGQNAKDSVVYDTIPARFQMYEDHCERCPFVIEEGYVVFKNVATYETIKIYNTPYTKDSATTLVMYLREPQQVDVNPYLRKNKLVMWMNYSVWDFKLDRECILNPIRGL